MSRTEGKGSEVPADRISINPYWVGGSFLEYCVKPGWMPREREGQSTRYYCNQTVVEALKQFGIEFLRPEQRNSRVQIRGSKE
jgi:hypothetical protein